MSPLTPVPADHTDSVLMAVLWRLKQKLGFRNVAELLLQQRHRVLMHHPTDLGGCEPRAQEALDP